VFQGTIADAYAFIKLSEAGQKIRNLTNIVWFYKYGKKWFRNFWNKFWTH
jgi:hypothetical protein